MTEEFVFPKSRLEFARVLKGNDNCTLKSLNFLDQYIDLNFNKRKVCKQFHQNTKHSQKGKEIVELPRRRIVAL